MTQKLPTVATGHFSNSAVNLPHFNVVDDGTVFNIADYIRIVRRYKWLIVFMVILGAVFGGWLALSKIPIYRATVSMVVELDRPNLTSVQGSVMAVYPQNGFYETQVQILKSRVVAQRAGEILQQRQVEVPEPVPVATWQAASMITKLKSGLNDILILTGISGSQASSSDLGQPPEQSNASPDNTIRRLAAFAGAIQIGGGGGQVMNILYESPNPVFAAEVVNAVAQAYIDIRKRNRLQRTQQAGSWLTTQLDSLREKVIESESRLHEYQASEGLIDLASLKQIATDQLSIFNQEVIEAQQRYSEVSKRYGPKHPKLIEATNELAVSRGRLNSAKQANVSTKQKQFELGKLEQEVNTNRQLYELFLARINEADHSTDEDLNNASILDSAEVPQVPVRPDRKKIVGTWALIGLMLGLVLAFIREQLDNTFKTHEQIEERLKLPVLGVVPLLGKESIHAVEKDAAGDSTGPIIPERYYIGKKSSPFGESINHLRTGVMFSNVDHPPKVVLVTSSLQGEGKTTLSSNLALSFSQLGRTLLIDADLRKPRMARVSGVSKHTGLVEYLTGQADLQNCMVRDRESSGLFILKSGHIPPSPLELLASEKFERLLEQFKKVFTHIIIDSAPLLPVSDAMVLSRLADATLLVVQSDKTTHSVVKESLRRLKAANNRPLGIVLSQVNYRRSYYYYDRNYYARSYYAGYGESQNA